MPLYDLRTFLDVLDKHGELKTVSGAETNLEIGAITEVALQNDGPALLFDQIPGYAPGYRVASNVCPTNRRGLLTMGMDPDLSEDEAMRQFKAKWDAYKPVPPRVVDRSPLLENIQTGDDVDLDQFPVPIWHEGDGGPYIGTGLAVIHQDPDTGEVNVGCYRVQRHDRRTTGLFTEPESDGRHVIEKYWRQGKACPVAISFGPEPLLFLSACTANGAPRGMQEYEYTGYIAGEPVPVIRGNVTGLPISAGSEIAIEGEIPPPSEETRTEGPFGEWTGYLEASDTPEPVIRIKALYYRNNPILFGAPPLQHRTSYTFTLPIRQIGMLSRLEKLGIPVRRVTSLVPLGCTVITVDQQHPDDVSRIMDALEKMSQPNRMTIIVDDDVDPNNPLEVLWAAGTRFDPTGARTSIIQSKWLLDPLRTIEDRINREARPYKRLFINGCRPFDRLKDFPPVNKFSESRRQATWDKWHMADWLAGTESSV
jgi:4-hydroxy-3-polyprenylbenzoate decarboxylase